MAWSSNIFRRVFSCLHAMLDHGCIPYSCSYSEASLQMVDIGLSFVPHHAVYPVQINLQKNIIQKKTSISCLDATSLFMLVDYNFSKPLEDEPFIGDAFYSIMVRQYYARWRPIVWTRYWTQRHSRQILKPTYPWSMPATRRENYGKLRNETAKIASTVPLLQDTRPDGTCAPMFTSAEGIISEATFEGETSEGSFGCVLGKQNPGKIAVWMRAGLWR